MRLQDYDTSDPFAATLVTTMRLTPAASDEVRELALDLSRPGFEAHAGQSLGVFAPGDHFRVYTLADAPEPLDGVTRIRLCVRRCTYVDEDSGERSPGVASNWLCDLHPGAELKMTGPYGVPFGIPPEPDATLILIGAGTGIAPFRAFVKRLYRERPDFAGKVLLFHGAQSPLDMIYRNKEKDDFAHYCDRDTFEAIEALSARPHWTDEIYWDEAFQSRGEELPMLLDRDRSYVYVAGLEQIRDRLDAALGEVLGSAERWAQRKAELVEAGRWVELLY